MPRVGQEPSAQDPAASSSSDALRGGVGVDGDAAEIIPSEDDAEAVELEHPDLMAELIACQDEKPCLPLPEKPDASLERMASKAAQDLAVSVDDGKGNHTSVREARS